MNTDEEMKWSDVLLVKSGSVIVMKNEDGVKRKFLLDEDLKVRTVKDKIKVLTKNRDLEEKVNV